MSRFRVFALHSKGCAPPVIRHARRGRHDARRTSERTRRALGDEADCAARACAAVPKSVCARNSSGQLAILAAIRSAHCAWSSTNEPRKEYVSFWNHHAAMSQSNDSRVEARECLRKANRGDAWLVLAKTWLLLAKTQENAKNNIEASGQKLTPLEG